MSDTLPELYFRTRDGAATVFRIRTDRGSRRLEFEPLANVNLGNGRIKPLGGRTIRSEEMRRIEAWLAERRETLARREIDDIFRTIDHLNATAHKLQTKAPDELVETIAQPLLLAMHDLRQTLIRRQAEIALKRRQVEAETGENSGK